MRTSNAFLFRVMDHISKKTGQKRERERETFENFEPGISNQLSPSEEEGSFFGPELCLPGAIFSRCMLLLKFSCIVILYRKDTSSV